MSDDALFPQAAPEHPDAQVAREEITRYYDDEVARAARGLEEAQARLVEATTARTAWAERGEITPENKAGPIDMTALVIVGKSQDRYHQATQKLLGTLDTRGGPVVNICDNTALREEAERLGQREKALRRWLTAQGHDLGVMAEPPPPGSLRDQNQRGRRRGRP